MSRGEQLCLQCNYPVRLHDSDMLADCFDKLYAPKPSSRRNLFLIALLTGLFLAFLLW